MRQDKLTEFSIEDTPTLAGEYELMEGESWRDYYKRIQEDHMSEVKEGLKTSQYLLHDLEREIKRIADLLGEKVEDLAIMDYSNAPMEYMDTGLRDNIISSHGVIESLPVIQNFRFHNEYAEMPGFGLFIMQPKGRPELKYAIYVARGRQHEESYIVVPKSKVFTLYRNMRRLNKEVSKDVVAPVLPDGMIEDVVRHTVGFLLKSKEIERYGVKIRRGLILDGSPGNGKTMLCRYIQKLCSQNSIYYGIVTSAEIDAAYRNKALGDLFTQYELTFFDDIDIAYMDRSRGDSKMACAMLTAMDGMHEGGHLIRIFTTNEKVEDMDPAFTRPGRIDKCITIQKPTETLRRKLIETVWPEEIRNGIDVPRLVQESDDFSFAELEAIRTFLVTNKILGDGTWDLDKAFKDFERRSSENTGKKRVGFGDKR